MKCDLCHEYREGLTWIGNAAGHVKVCKDCLDELVATRAEPKPTGEPEPQPEIA